MGFNSRYAIKHRTEKALNVLLSEISEGDHHKKE